MKIWRAIGFGILGGIAVTCLMLAVLVELGTAPLGLTPFLIAPFAWWGSGRAQSRWEGTGLGLIAVGSPIVVLAVIAQSLFGDWTFLVREKETLVILIPAIAAGAFVGSLKGAKNEEELSSF